LGTDTLDLSLDSSIWHSDNSELKKCLEVARITHLSLWKFSYKKCFSCYAP